MKRFNNLSTRGKLILGFGAMWLMLAMVIVVAYGDIGRLAQSERELHDIHFNDALAMMQVRSHLNHNRWEMLAMILTPDKSSQDALEESVGQRQEAIDVLITNVFGNDPDPQCQALLKQFTDAQAAYRQTRDQVRALIQQGKTAEAGQLALGIQAQRYETLRSIAVELGDRQSAEVDQQLALDVQMAAAATRLFLLLGGVALLLSIGMVVFLSHAIASPINALSQAAARIASRDDLGLDITAVERTDEVGKLTQAFRQMLENLRRSTTDISEGKRLEEELRTASLYARNLIEASLDPLVTISPEGKITDVNQTTEQVTGVSRERLIGSDFADYFTEPEKARAGYKQVFSQGLVTDYPLTLRHVSGRTTDVLYNASVYKNEAGDVQGVFAAARDITERKLKDEELRSYREHLEEMIKQRTAALTNVLTEVKEMVGVLTASASEILASSTQVASSSAETATAISETTTTVEEVRQAAQLSSQKAQTVSDSAQRVAQVSQSGQKAVEETSAGMDRIRSQMETIAQTIVRLSEQSQSIGGIIAAVTDLAGQSNLLAVNGAIEAAKAGEQGRGFAVVAQEIKSLADQSKQATTQVRGILNDVQKATGNAVMATEQGSKAVEAGVKQAAQAGEAIRVLAETSGEAVQAATLIVTSSHQQVVGMDQIGMAMENINQAGAQNAASMKQMEVAAQNLHQLGQKLKELTEKFQV